MYHTVHVFSSFISFAMYLTGLTHASIVSTSLLTRHMKYCSRSFSLQYKKVEDLELNDLVLGLCVCVCVCVCVILCCCFLTYLCVRQGNVSHHYCSCTRIIILLYSLLATGVVIF